MGLTHIDGRVRGSNGQEEPVRFLVDSGASQTVLPTVTWRALGLAPRSTETFELADGSTVQRGVAEAYLTLPQGAVTTQVVLGEPGDEPLLGALTLEQLGLVLDPLRRELRKMRLRM